MMKTTLEIPDEIYRETKSAAALRGESVKDFVNEAIRIHLARIGRGMDSAESGWRRVFGKTSSKVTAEIDRVIDHEFGQVEPDDWT